MRDHPLDQRLRKFAHALRSRAKFPKVLDVLGPFAMLEVAPEMILDRRFARSSPFPHNIYFLRSSDMTLAISTTARAASVPRLILFSRQRSRA
jgi:hypothetical protein